VSGIRTNGRVLHRRREFRSAACRNRPCRRRAEPHTGKQTTPPSGATHSSNSSPAIHSLTSWRRWRICVRIGSRIWVRRARICSATHSSITLPQILICSWLRETAPQARVPGDQPANPKTGHAVGLRQGRNTDDMRSERGCQRRSRAIRQVPISFVHQQVAIAVLGELDEKAQVRFAVRDACGIVRARNTDEFSCAA